MFQEQTVPVHPGCGSGDRRLGRGPPWNVCRRDQNPRHTSKVILITTVAINTITIAILNFEFQPGLRRGGGGLSDPVLLNARLRG